jgi:dephospho-CoA kinase
MSLVVGLTGGIGAGKSLVAQYFAELGARVVDADGLARVAIERGSVGFDQVVERFGEEILRDGDIDRKALAAIVFADPSARKDLEEIVHPRIRRLFAQVLEDLHADEILIYEIPLLVETSAREKFDYIITVEAPLDIRRERLLNRKMSPSEIDRRIATQADEAARTAIADTVIRNDGDEDHLLRLVENIWEDLERRSK